MPLTRAWIMPLYEYQCVVCNTVFQKLVLTPKEKKQVCCPKCGEQNVKRLISRVAYHVSETDRISNFDPAIRQSDSFYKDSRNIGLSAQKRAQQMGVDLGKGFGEKLEKFRSNPGSVLHDSE